jgi:hypothetical protein
VINWCVITIEFENTLLIKFESGWLEKIKELPKLCLYKEIKRNFSTENYIRMSLPKYQRSILAQFRLCILPIKMETGRYKGEARDDRLCMFCSSDEIQNIQIFDQNYVLVSDVTQLYLCLVQNVSILFYKIFPGKRPNIYIQLTYIDSLCCIVNAMCNSCTYLRCYLS